MMQGDQVRIDAGPRQGATGRLMRVGIADGHVKLDSTGVTVAVPLLYLRRIDLRPVSAEDARLPGRVAS